MSSVHSAKKVLFISPQPFFQWRGSPIRVRFVLKSLGQSGHRVDLLTLPFGEDQEITNVRIIRVVNLFRADNVPIGPSLLKLGFDFILLYKAVSLLRKQEYDVIHGIEEAGFMAVFLGRIFGQKAVFEKHSDPFSYRKGIVKNLFLSLYAAVENRVIKRADLIICTGTGLSQQVHNMGTGQPVHTIFDMPSSIQEADPDKTARIGQQLRSHADEILVIYVGSFAVYQGVDLMFAAMPGVLNGSDRVRFVIIGGSPDQIKTRQGQLKEQGLDKRVTFVGVVPPDELPDYLAASDICLSPRYSGVNTPLKVLDYYKAGRAVVATDIPSNQVILTETTALFSRPEPDSFADQILVLAGNPDLRQRLGINGRHLYEQKYSFAAFQKRLECGYAVLENTSEMKGQNK